jgi:hypothetical protein
MNTTGAVNPGDPEAFVSTVNATLPAHDKEMARRFLAALDPNATRFTFQFFNDRGSGRAQITHGTLDDVWSKVLALNTPRQGVGVFVTVNETDFQGRSAENVVRARALFADADGKEQVASCATVLNTCGVSPSMSSTAVAAAHMFTFAPMSLLTSSRLCRSC